ncbi:FAD-dependent monooxygenase [Streptomyces sp. P38-E01]|uniref:FAD-dependent monooxygenase n=1 Tax=Streptomyces tardus TaxID=2780544 RepID=A0A949JCC6_9ACTN|nr:FAD-dependent oxidoreductase [Streptomyces tardus]MBU7597437.1 FAD-dependent monooxygenase [Streptomyces tardus]
MTESGVPEDRTVRGRHVVVVGGSLAGLLAARVLAEHAERVTVVERDRLPDGPRARAGVPQSRHVHVLMEGGADALEDLLPGIVEELVAHGAPRVGMPSDTVHWQGGTFHRRTAATVHLMSGSRPLVEWLVRRRVLEDPRISVLEGTEVVELTGDARRVTGVGVRERGAGRGAERGELRRLAASLVVDASGRSTRAPSWLEALGAAAVPEERIETGLAYATGTFVPPSGEGPDGATAGLSTAGFYFVPDGNNVRGASVLPIEGGRSLVTLIGLRGTEPPTDPEEFRAFTARLPHPVLHDWLVGAEQEGAIHAFRATGNVRRRYDRTDRRTAGFLATGDALCAFNPVYGQGMAVAALSAVALRDSLSDPRRTPSGARVQRALLAASRQAWDIATGADKELPGARGNAVGASRADRVLGRYLARVVERTAHDPVVGTAFRAVSSLKAPPGTLFAPEVLRAVLFGGSPGPCTELPLRPEEERR